MGELHKEWAEAVVGEIRSLPKSVGANVRGVTPGLKRKSKVLFPVIFDALVGPKGRTQGQAKKWTKYLFKEKTQSL